MKVWPLNSKILENPDSENADQKKTGFKKFQVPQKGETGSFWEKRGDRYHCGVDLYDPENTE